MPAALPAALLGAHVLLAAADGPPRFNIEATCKSPGRASVSNDAGADGCLRSERAAGDDLRKRWGDFSGTAKRQCSQQSRAGGFPSYVEMLTCLELASGNVPVHGPENGATAGQGGAGPATTGSTRRGEEGTALTTAPSPQQRTDPLRVLGKPAR
ncbi:conserved hypothetical protein [Methylobacterium sp. 4-46]|uniref:hypothetical protein n=1 Tax=unclassified Methylobacterium TaxID=2615210 RepID=UPI000152CC2C|nr:MULTISPECIES: hypothetical protein [Methylobacterium]ACA15929.1 conserved hypothetical protein [Methylobacterium sp. 4-46]WFT81646.1 hypothetical protein QA634_07170 [Methylobacterium nodulans]